MTIQWTVYDSNTGEILRTGTAMTTATANLQGGTPGTRVVLVGSDPVTQSIDPANPDQGPIGRQRMKVGTTFTDVNTTAIAANGVAAVVISPIPVGAKYDVYLPIDLGLIQPPDGIINDGELRLTTTVPGIYSVKISYQNFLDFQVTFNAG